MIVHSEKQSLQTELLPFRQKKQSVGLVPTMGALHAGHLSLIRRAMEENDLVVVSIFVNPTQFDNAGDLEKYPRTMEADIALLKTVSNNILIFNPSPGDLYNGKIESKHYNFSGLEDEMEGKHRKGHFEGVGTVLNLLFRSVRPAKAYFGEKDFQQLQVVRKMVEIEDLPVKIVGCEIVRESHGLAMSSRNKRLTPLQFREASLIYETLSEVKKKFKELSIPMVLKSSSQEANATITVSTTTNFGNKFLIFIDSKKCD